MRGGKLPLTLHSTKEILNVAYKKVTTIGIGTLGGFVADAVASLDDVEELVIVDHDTVENKNLRNSIYRPIDIGSLKVDALEDILSEKYDIKVKKLPLKFDEEKVPIAKSDLVFDCRDFTYNRGSYIDARLYISSRYLVVDTRKNVIYDKPVEGRYIETLTKDDLRYAAMLVSMMIHSGTIKTLLQIQTVQKYEVDYVKRIDNLCYDILYDNAPGSDKFINLPAKILPILDLNRTSDLNVFVGSKSFPLSSKVIPRESLKDGNDIIINLASVANLQCNFNHYIVSVYQENGKNFIELIPETGAA